MRKRFAIVATIGMVIAVLLTGCSFSAGSSAKSEDYKDIFTDRYEEASKDNKYKGTMVAYNYSLPGYGEMQIYVDTTEGHKFELVENSSAFQVKDKDGNLAVTGMIMDKDQYAQYSAYANDNYVINGRQFYGLVNEYGSLDLYSYAADCGVDGGLVLEATEESLFRLVAFRGTPIEGALDQAAYKGVAEGTETTEVIDVESLLGPTTMGFANGYVFDLTKCTIEDHQGFNFKIEGSESVVEAAITDEYTAFEAIDTMATNIKEESGEAPLIDTHKEGVYLTGFYNDAFILCFAAEGDGVTYIMSMRTVDADNCIDIFNGIISDFLRGGATEYSVRTEYGEEVGEDDAVSDDLADIDEAVDNILNEDSSSDVEYEPHTDKYYKIPSGYTCIYSCDYFDTLAGDEYEYTFNFDADEELLSFAKGKGDKYLDYDLEKISEIDSSYGKIIICMHGNDGYYRYHAISEDGTVAIDFNSAYSEKIDKKTCEKLVKDVVK